eukprot:TRINITY_DN10544_c0_g1_i2.p1 TRINITY_DN10544_c0_g1~~TRINITY_DN10544_c0_g1_i2.p1  ORF type:complete len:330 (-),score=-12.18 TRINITY_DN10544_c0_g1_i2:80-1069(-)
MLTGDNFYEFIMASNEGFRIVNKLGEIVEANEAYCQLIGVAKSQILGSHISNYETYRSQESYSEHFENVRKSGIAKYETSAVCKNIRKIFEAREMYFPGESSYIYAGIKEISQTQISRSEDDAISDHEKIKAILSTIPYPIFAKDNKLKYIECNKAFENYIGKTREEIIGFDIFDIFEKDVAQIYQTADLNLLKSKQLQIYETVLKYNDGIMHEVIFHKNVIRNSNNTVVGIVGVVEDISERKASEKKIGIYIDELNKLNEKLAENKAWFQMISDYSNNWEVFRDKNNKITYCSPSIEKLLGYKVVEYIAQVAFTDYIYPDDFEYAYRE